MQAAVWALVGAVRQEEPLPASCRPAWAGGLSFLTAWWLGSNRREVTAAASLKGEALDRSDIISTVSHWPKRSQAQPRLTSVEN